MNVCDAPTADIRQSNQRPETKVVDTAIARAAGVREVGAGTSAAVDEQGGEGLVGGLAACCPIWCGAAIDGEVNYCCPSCREICEGLSA